jgi:hypothetical protein
MCTSDSIALADGRRRLAADGDQPSRPCAHVHAASRRQLPTYDHAAGNNCT